MGTLNIDKIFNPQNVAIIGASDEEGSVGCAIVKNFTQSGYQGKVYLVNNRKPEILGIKTYYTVGEIPEPVDLVLIATPAKTVPDIVKQCGMAGVGAAIIISAGFKETGPEVKALENKIFENAAIINVVRKDSGSVSLPKRSFTFVSVYGRLLYS
jgi:acetyltransferase